MDYNKEAENLDQGSSAYKPEEGQHRIEILEEPEETEYKDDKGNVTPQIKLKIKVDNTEEEHDWYIGKGKTSKSVYGQLMKVGAKQGQLKGQTITLFVTRAKNADGNMVNSYVIPEAMKDNTTEETV